MACVAGDGSKVGRRISTERVVRGVTARGAESTGVALIGRGGTGCSKTGSGASGVAVGAATELTTGGAGTGVVTVGDGPGRPGPEVFALPRAAVIDDAVRSGDAETGRAAGSSGSGDSTAIRTATPTNPKMSDAMQYPTRLLNATLRLAGGAYPSEAGTELPLERLDDGSPAMRPGGGSPAARPGGDSAEPRTEDVSSASRASTERRRSALRMMLTAR